MEALLSMKVLWNLEICEVMDLFSYAVQTLDSLEIQSVTPQMEDHRGQPTDAASDVFAVLIKTSLDRLILVFE
jgi:hypothetical protein